MKEIEEHATAVLIGVSAGVTLSLLGIWAWVWWQFMVKPCREHQRAAERVRAANLREFQRHSEGIVGSTFTRDTRECGFMGCGDRACESQCTGKPRS